MKGAKTNWYLIEYLKTVLESGSEWFVRTEVDHACQVKKVHV